MNERITMAHGAGGRAMRELVQAVLTTGPGHDMDDGAVVPIGDRFLVFTTDSHVVQPLFFPGGDIGRLAVCGTVNDLAMMGATDVIGLSCALVIEEGFSIDLLRQVKQSMDHACAEADTRILTGDTKVMARGEVDGLVINTAGIGLTSRVITHGGLRPGDHVLVTGTIGDHGMAVMARRHGLERELRSDVAPLGSLIACAREAGGADVIALKDPTRGGLASCLHEMASHSGVGIELDEARLPIDPTVRAAAELFGIDPLVVANEGKAVLGVRPEAVRRVLGALRAHPLGGRAADIGVAKAEHAGRVVLDTGFGRRLLAEPEGEILPRIC